MPAPPLRWMLLFLSFIDFKAVLTADAAAHAGDLSAGDTLYQKGMDHYADGDMDAAAAAFRELLKREPGNHSALAAVRRLEIEAGSKSRPLKSSPAPAPIRRPAFEGVFERFFLVTLPRWYNFERSLGDALMDVGTLDATNARVIQLFGERKVAIAKNRPFPNERRLRELLRRAPVTAFKFEQV